MVDRCLNCQYYDRKRERSESGQFLRWGQCRRTAPLLNPVPGKSYMIEGVWPTVRDDDWCGEWKTMPARPVPRRPEPHATVPAGRESAHGVPRAVPHPAADAANVATAGVPTLVPLPLAAAAVGAD